jgi:glutamyl-tRNA synthetase
MSPIVRFAPSPTGRIHIGNARTALLNWLFALRRGGQFILRYDDTDIERSRMEYADAIAVDLAWLGITPHLVRRQSERIALYDEAARKLADAGRLYPCYETPEELDRRRKRQQALGRPPIYDRAALRLTPEERAALEAAGRRPHWRFKLDAITVRWSDLVRGESHIDCASLSDPVLRREDGSFLYTLPSVVDDIDLEVTHVIRGEDHVTNTAVQIQIFEALTGGAPMFGHHNLLTDASGEGLSKRTGALSIASLRESGIEALAAAALAVLTGSAESVRPIASLEELAETFELSQLSHAPARFDEAELRALSARTLHGMSFAAVRDRLAALGVSGPGAEAFWAAARGNLAKLDDALIWWNVVHGEVTPIIEDAEFLAKAAAALPPEPWGAPTWAEWTGALKRETGRKGRELFHPLRLALTGRDSGPELAALLPLIGWARASARLSAPSA